jgi:hypothetical protein
MKLSRSRWKADPLLAGYLFGSLFDPENEGSTLLRNIYEILPDYTTSYQRI